ncbi:hypothetical protein JIQ42_08391 [Leishmania sp. Namibia]|uniref:hypothetical protein n=1 Tax=Leishmania sp. Namibia TaxID=2802991 RepID=UPI001B46419F|nr:hypothetical protein JIQ42_08391 [Leishmania sp. Namibia]
MTSVDRCPGDHLADTAVQSSPPPHQWYISPRQSPSPPCMNYKHQPSRSARDRSRTSGSDEAAFIPRLGASHDLPSSVTQFLSLSSASGSVAAKELRRQLLVLRDYCVGLGNKIKGKELLSQGGRYVSRKVEATADFNSCLGVIFATSLVFAGGTEDDAKDTLRSILEKLKAAQDSGDERVFRAAIVEVVNRILLCTPLKPPARDAAREEAQKSGRRKKRRIAERQLKDECLDFLTVEDGVPLLLEGVWKRWLNYFEEGYIRYVESLLVEQQRAVEAAAAAACEADGEDEADYNGNAALVAAVPAIATVPLFAGWQSYWKSTTSAYAQFCYLLLAIFFVRTKDFSLNYLARVTKLVHYYTYQLESEEGDPIAVKVVDVDVSDDESEEEGEEWAQPEEEECSLPMPEYDSGVTRRTLMSVSLSAERERSSVGESHEVPGKPRRRWHKCFTTEELPEELRPSADAVKEEEAVAARDAQEHSQVPAVRHTDKMEILDVSVSRQRERE